MEAAVKIQQRTECRHVGQEVDGQELSTKFRTRVTPHQHSGDEAALQHHPCAGRSQTVDKKCNVGLVMNQQRSESGVEERDSSGAENRHGHPQGQKTVEVQYINSNRQKVQQITEVSQQCMNIEVPAEIQCQNTAKHPLCLQSCQPLFASGVPPKSLLLLKCFVLSHVFSSLILASTAASLQPFFCILLRSCCAWSPFIQCSIPTDTPKNQLFVHQTVCTFRTRIP